MTWNGEKIHVAHHEYLLFIAWVGDPDENTHVEFGWHYNDALDCLLEHLASQVDDGVLLRPSLPNNGFL